MDSARSGKRVHSGYRERRITSAPELVSVLSAADWSEIDDRTQTPMQGSAWILSCAEAIPAERRLETLLFEDDRGVAALAPLARSPSDPTQCVLLCEHELHEPSDFIARDAESLAALLAALRRQPVPMRIERLPGSSTLIAPMRRAFRGRGVVVCRPAVGWPHIEIGASGCDADALLTTRLRSDLRRAERKAEGLGRVEYEVHAPASVSEFTPLFELATEIEARGWKERAGSSLRANQCQQTFFRRFGARASAQGHLRLAFLRIGGTPVAMQYAVEWNRRFWLLKIGFDEAWSRASPGLLLMRHTLRHAVQQGLRSYEFLGSPEEWTRRWTTAERTTQRLAVYPFSRAGIVTGGADLAAAVHRRWRAMRARRAKGPSEPTAPAEPAESAEPAEPAESAEQ